MASALDKLREHTAALEAVVKAAQEIERVLERVQAELVPLVGDLREVRRGTEKIRKQQDAGGFSWAVLMVLCSGLGGVVGGWSCWCCASDLRDCRSPPPAKREESPNGIRDDLPWDSSWRWMASMARH